MIKVALLAKDPAIIGDFELCIRDLKDGEVLGRVITADDAGQMAPGEADIVIYDLDMAGKAQVTQLFETWERPPELLPLLGLADKVREAGTGSGGLFLDKPIGRRNFVSTLGQVVDIIRGRGNQVWQSLTEVMADDFNTFLKERFWKDIITGIIGNARGEIVRKATGIRLSGEELYVLPILVEFRQWLKDMPLKEKLLSLMLLKLQAQQTLLSEDRGSIIQVRDELMVVLRTGEDPAAPRLTQVTESCLGFVDTCERSFSVVATCCVGEVVFADGLSDQFDALVKVNRENITNEKLQFLRFGVSDKPGVLLQPDLPGWKAMLSGGLYDKTLIAVTEYFFSAMAANRLTLESLRIFSHDFQQILYAVLLEKGVAAHKVFGNEKGHALWQNATDSVSELLTWVFWSVGEMSRCIESAEESPNKLSEVVRYIDGNLGGDISRDELSRRMHMSQSTLARMFKKETGMTLTDYIFSKRMDTAKKLLSATSLPIGEAAERCGFRNYSYFYTRFREETGMSPSEYRERQSREPGS